VVVSAVAREGDGDGVAAGVAEVEDAVAMTRMA
jgi:hypothetical protein